MLFFSASMRSTTFSPRGRGLAAMVLPLRFAFMQLDGVAIDDGAFIVGGVRHIQAKEQGGYGNYA
jgi:hypothetical protein